MVVAVLLTAAVFVGMVGVVVRLARRQLPGEVDVPPPVRPVRPDHPAAPSPVVEPTASGPADPDDLPEPDLPEPDLPEPDLPESDLADLADLDDFARWEAEHWPRSEQ